MKINIKYNKKMSNDNEWIIKPIDKKKFEDNCFLDKISFLLKNDLKEIYSEKLLDFVEKNILNDKKNTDNFIDFINTIVFYINYGMMKANKRCENCEDIKPCTDFGKFINSKDGLRKECNDCVIKKKPDKNKK